ncbi:unnamed protein product [Nesidiocoris tenuis]|uniref:Hexosyltransferase n=1 Tax=Nesidiocoris tenuis TaxID=355587 RepID=A0A6H5HSF2_9HEMI|nr:unnamed protein product [Nesidiocoris tenuis]
MGIGRVASQHYSLFIWLILGLVANRLLENLIVTDCATEDERLPQPTAVPPPREPLNPSVNLAEKPRVPKKVAKNFVRPRYYSTELGIRERILMGVLTTESTVRSLAVAINKTSYSYVDKLLFFMDAAGAEKAQVVNLKLPGIVGFVDAREILKPFHALKYLTDNFMEEYDLFLLMRDTTYVNPYILTEMVKDISASEDVHAGFPPSTESSLYCSLDSGIMLSNSILKKVRSSLDWCVKNAFSDSDDDNVGRCILHATQSPCKNLTSKGRRLSTKKMSGVDVGKLQPANLDNVFSYYPLKKDQTVYQLHLLLSKKTLYALNGELEDMESKIDSHQLAWPPGSYHSKSPATRFDLLPWQYFDNENIYLTSDFDIGDKLFGATKADILDIIDRTASWANQKYPDLVYQQLMYGYRRFDPSRGIDYLLEMAFTDNSGCTVRKRDYGRILIQIFDFAFSRSFEVCKELGKAEMLPMPYVTETGRVHILLPVFASDYAAANNFMTKYAESCSQVDLTFLILVPRVDGGAAPMEDHLLYFAMMDLVSKKLPGESLLLFTEPYAEFKQDFMNRVRMGTISNKQVYSPVPFSEYDPKLVYQNASEIPGLLEIHKNSGRFDLNNVQHLSFYMSDYIASRSYLSYIPVVKGDKDIAKMFTAYSTSKIPNKIVSLVDMFARTDLSVLRSAEPSLRLRRRPCSAGSPEFPRDTSYSRCSAPMGTRSQLGQAVLDKHLPS